MKRHLTLLFSALAGFAMADNVMHNMVSRHTPVNTNLIGAVVGEGLSLSNGVLSATGGGGTDGEAVTNIVEGIVRDATNAIPRGVTIDLLGDGSAIATNAALSGTAYTEWNNYGELPDGQLTYGLDLVFDEIAQHEAFADRYPAKTSLGTAAYKDSSEFATAADEALVYQLLTNRLSGVTFDFATVAGLYLAISNIVAAQGGAITNFPAIP